MSGRFVDFTREELEFAISTAQRAASTFPYDVAGVYNAAMVLRMVGSRCDLGTQAWFEQAVRNIERLTEEVTMSRKLIRFIVDRLNGRPDGRPGMLAGPFEKKFIQPRLWAIGDALMTHVKHIRDYVGIDILR